MGIEFSRRLALIAGFVLPLGETLRRWHQLGDIRYWPAWLDDWTIGALLLYGFWRTGKDLARGIPFLAAGWGFACAMGYNSFFFQLTRLDEPDPSGVSTVLVVTLKGIGFALAIVALVATLRWKPSE